MEFLVVNFNSERNPRTLGALVTFTVVGASEKRRSLYVLDDGGTSIIEPVYQEINHSPVSSMTCRLTLRSKFIKGVQVYPIQIIVYGLSKSRRKVCLSFPLFGTVSVLHRGGGLKEETMGIRRILTILIKYPGGPPSIPFTKIKKRKM